MKLIRISKTPTDKKKTKFLSHYETGSLPQEHFMITSVVLLEIKIDKR